MKVRAKLIALIVLSVIIAATVAGCQSKGRKEVEVTTTVQPSPTPTPTPTQTAVQEIDDVSKDLQDLEQLLKELEDLDNVDFEV